MKETKTQARKPSDAKKPLKKNTVPKVKPSLRTGMVALILAAVILSLYGHTLRFGFTWFDDDAILLRNQPFVSDLSNIGHALLRDAEFRPKSMELYRPLQNVSFMVDAAFGGYEHPGVFHFTNLLFHFLASFLLFLLMKRLGFSARLSLLGSLILAIHPVFAFTVCWLPARGDLLLAVISLASLILLLDFLSTRQPRFLILHLLAFFLALMAKETAVMIAPIALLLLIRNEGIPKLQRWHYLTAAGYLALTAGFLVMRTNAVASVKGEGFALTGLFHNLPVLPEVLLKFFIPWPLAALPFYSAVATGVGIVISGVIIWLLFKLKIKRIDALAFFIWFLLFSLPAMLYNPHWSGYIYDYVIHRSYLPLTGILLLALLMVKPFEDRLFGSSWRHLLAGFAVIWLVINVQFAKNFSEPLKFWEYAVKTNPRSAFAHTYLGGARFFAGMKQEAVASYDEALLLKPDFREAILNRGITLASLGEHQRALADFDSCLSITPKDTMVLRYRAVSLSETGDFRAALKDLDMLVSLGDTLVRTRFQWGLANLLSGEYHRAATLFDELLRKEPGNQQYLRLGALSALMDGNPDRAVERYRKLISVTSPDQNAFANLGYALWEQGAYADALTSFKEALAKGPEDLSINLGFLITYSKQGDQKSLQETLARTYILNPELRKFDEAIEKLTRQGYLFTPAQIQTLGSILR